MFIADEKRAERVDVGPTTSIVTPDRRPTAPMHVMRHAPVTQTPTASGGAGRGPITVILKIGEHDFRNVTNNVVLQKMEKYY